jgi:hypothetical protein
MKKLLILSLVCACVSVASAQDDLLSSLEKQSAPKTTYTMATFKGTRIINGHNVETLKKKHLDYLISHRFGAIGFDRPFYDFLGMDGANIRMAFEYGLSDNFTVGLGRNSLGKAYDFYGKYKLAAQATGEKSFPMTVTLFGSLATNTEDSSPQARYFSNNDRLSYTTQLLVARKMSENLSVQVAPTYIRRNRTLSETDKDGLLAVGFGARYKLNKRFSINAEYYWLADNSNLNLQNNQKRYNSASIGVDIETGGHVFQLHFSNSSSMIEKQFITETIGTSQDLHFGFNISRIFSLDKRAKGMMK